MSIHLEGIVNQLAFKAMVFSKRLSFRRSQYLLIVLMLSPLLGLSVAHGQSVDWDNVDARTVNVVYSKVKNSYLHPRWMKDTPYFYYHIEATGQPNEHILVNAKSGKQEPLLKDTRQFMNQFTQLTGDSTVSGESFRLYKVEFLDKQLRELKISYKGKLLRYNRRTGKLSLWQEGDDSNEEENAPLSENEEDIYKVITKGDSLYCKQISTGEEWRIDGWSPKHNVEGRSRFWTGDYYIEFGREKSDNLKQMAVVESTRKGRPRVNLFDMPMPGEDNFSTAYLFCYNVKTRKGAVLDIAKFENEEITLSSHYTDEYLYFDRKSRTGGVVELCRVELASGRVTTLIHEDTHPQYNRSLFNYRFIKDGRELLWWSERDGYGKYYLYSAEGKLIKQLFHDSTRVAGQIVEVDEKRGEMICVAYGGADISNPYYARYFSVPLNGKGERHMAASVPEGEEELSLSPDKKYGLLKVSRPDLTPHFYAVDLSSRRSHPHFLYAMSEEHAKAAGWVKPEMVSVLSGDNKTPLYGIMYLPSDFNSSKKYPVIAYVYPGPQTDLLPTSFSLDDSGNQSLAELGFIVVQVPPRGSSPNRGQAFYTYGHGNLRDYPLEDTKLAVERLAKKYPYMDLDRVGIYGHSGGGFAALTSMLTYPDFYKACVAASGNYDNNIYIQWWGESFHGVEEVIDPESGKISYQSVIPTTMELAENLRGPLLLVTGDQDRNVPPSSTYRMVDALMKAGKTFDMLVMPGFDHELDGPYFYNKVRYFFLEHLKGERSDHINILEHK